MSFGTTPLSSTVLGANQFPVSAVYPPNSSGGNFIALQGGPISTDAQNNSYAPAAMYVPDGYNVTLGTTTDTSSVNTLIGLTKAIKANTASVMIGSALPAGNNVIGVVAFGGTTAVGVPANSGVFVVKGSQGRLASAIVTTTGSAQLNIYDNVSQASGTIIGAVPANAAVGSVYQFNSPAANGIVANSVASCCAVTICYY